MLQTLEFKTMIGQRLVKIIPCLKDRPIARKSSSASFMLGNPLQISISD